MELGTNILRFSPIGGQRPCLSIEAFTFKEYGALVSLGRYNSYGTLTKHGLFRGAVFHGRVAQLSHAMLYRMHQVELYGVLAQLSDLDHRRLDLSCSPANPTGLRARRLKSATVHTIRSGFQNL